MGGEAQKNSAQHLQKPLLFRQYLLRLDLFEPEKPLPAAAKVVLRGVYFVWSEGKVEEFAEEE